MAENNLPDEDWQNEYSRRDQQWIQDHFVRLIGRTAYFPESTPGYSDVNRAFDDARFGREAMDNLVQIGDHHFRTARTKEEQGLEETAFYYFYRAAIAYVQAQWSILDEDDEDKIEWHGRAMDSYDKVIELNPNYEMEKVEIDLPFHDESMPAVFHKSGVDNAPTVLVVPGMDQAKEQAQNPLANPFIGRGFNTLAIDGPGQAEARMRGIRADSYDTYQRAGSAAIDWLVDRPEVDEEKIGIRGISMGSYWGPRIAYEDERVSALAVGMGCWYSKDLLFNQAQPFFKKRFMWMSGITDEDEFGEYMDGLTLYGIDEEIDTPTFIAHGEYDELQTREQAKMLYERLAGPVHLQLYENEFHPLGRVRPDFYYDMVDWFTRVWDDDIDDDYREAVFMPDYPSGEYISSPKFDFLDSNVTPAERLD